MTLLNDLIAPDSGWRLFNATAVNNHGQIVGQGYWQGGLRAFRLDPMNYAPGTRHVWPHSPRPQAPYTNWLTAAHRLQDAVDVAQPGDTVLVAGGLLALARRPSAAPTLGWQPPVHA